MKEGLSTRAEDLNLLHKNGLLSLLYGKRTKHLFVHAATKFNFSLTVDATSETEQVYKHIVEHKSHLYAFTQQTEAHCYEYFDKILFTFLVENKKNLAAHQCTKKQKTPDQFSPKIPIISPVLTFFMFFFEFSFSSFFSSKFLRTL